MGCFSSWNQFRIGSRRSVALLLAVALLTTSKSPSLALSTHQTKPSHPLQSTHKSTSNHHHRHPTNQPFDPPSQVPPQEQPQQQQQLITRRNVLALVSGWTTAAFLIPPSFAGEVGAKITKAVTTSDLGISVRTSVVRGAQVMDQIDGKWEQFSDRFGLGAERSKQQVRPQPKVIPDPLPLDVEVANTILKMADEVFLNLLTSVQQATLERQIEQVQRLVQPSFERSTRGGEAVDLGNSVRNVQTAVQFNFASYVHFKAYSDLILQQGKGFDFNSFRRKYEDQLGQKLVAVLINQKASRKKASESSLNTILGQIDQVSSVLTAKGLLSLTERSELDKEQLADWLDDLSELTFTIALDGDITLGSQMLLQEQGFRLYPDFARFAIASLLRTLEGQDVSVDDYYFDTDYNSDPDRFEVKEIILNVALDSST